MILVPDRRIWTQQPQQPVDIDLDAPINRRLVMASKQGVGNSGTWGRSVSDRGIALTTNGTSQVLFMGAVPVLGDFTLFVIAKETAVNNLPLCSRTAPNTQGVDVLIGAGGTSGEWAVRFGSSDGNALPTVFSSGFGDGKYHSICAVRSGGSLTQYGDGILLGTDATGFTGSITSSQGLRQGDRNGTKFSSNILFYSLHSRALRKEEVKSLHENCWQIYAKQEDVIYIDTAVSGITGTSSTTQGSNAVSATGAIAIAGTASIAQAGNSASATGTLAIAGVVSAAQAGNTVAAEGTLVSGISGSASIQQAGNSASATGTIAITGQSSTTQAGNSVASSGTVALTGQSATAQGGNAVVAAGTLTDGPSGSVSVEQGSNAVSATGTIAITGYSSIAQGAHSLVAIGQVPIIGTLASQLEATTVVATGVVGGAMTLTPADIDAVAAAILLAAQTSPIWANVIQVNSVTLTGSGVPADPMRPA